MAFVEKERKIGKIRLDLTWYSGEDLYSDGEIEDEMLEFARSVPAAERNQAVAASKSWPILYHFSHIRGNIVDWYPFQGTEKVLEIGAGCGAVTETLCSLAGSVTALDLSFKRSQINAWRSRDRENLQIVVGNFEDVEPHLPEDYDVITLIGVFEYGQSYIHSADPYADFLKKVTRHLAPDGKLLVAIENRFGLKYWAGCTEDHTGRLFDGLEEYPAGGSARTFTKKEWEELLHRAGGLQAQWYYPWPDYKFPFSIYSDERLPQKGEIEGENRNFDRLRLELFRESAVGDSLVENGLFDWFANSYLLVIGREKPELPMIYTRFSNERDPAFCVRTDILKEKTTGSLIVRKTRWTDPGAKENLSLHTDEYAAIASLPIKTRALDEIYSRAGFEPNRILSASEQEVCLAYVSGQSLEEILDGKIREGDLKGCCDLLLGFADRIRQVCGGLPFEETEEFAKLFGACRFKGEPQSAGVCNLDLLAHNLYPADDRTRVLDVEWTFSFPIPADYVVWRFLHYYLEGDSKRHPLKVMGLYEQAGLCPEDLPVFEEMERSFQRYILGGTVPMRSMYESISAGAVDARGYFERIEGAGAPRTLQMFWDCGRSFREEDSIRLPLSRKEMKLRVPEGTQRLRLDPGEAPGGFYIRKLTWSDGIPARFSTNGFPLGVDAFYFGSGDPQIILDPVPAGTDFLILELEPLQEQKAQDAFWKAFAVREAERNAHMQDLKNRLKLANEQIRQMENTKIWKLYQTIRKR